MLTPRPWMSRARRLLTYIALFFGGVAVVSAQCVRDIYAVDAGWYDVTGFHNPANEVYLAGDSSVTGARPPYRNWFVFPIPSLRGPVESAAMEIHTHEAGSPTGAEWFQLREVTTPVEILRAGGAGRTDIYQDLADGTIFGG